MYQFAKCFFLLQNSLNELILNSLQENAIENTKFEWWCFHRKLQNQFGINMIKVLELKVLAIEEKKLQN